MKANRSNWRDAIGSLGKAWDRFWTKRRQQMIERSSGGRIRFVDEPQPFVVDPVAQKIDWIGSRGKR